MGLPQESRVRAGAIALLGLLALTPSTEASLSGSGMTPFFVAQGGVQATLGFRGRVEFSLKRGEVDEADDVAREAIEEQLFYLVGSLRSYRVAPKADHEVTDLRWETEPGPGTRAVTYEYRGTVLVPENVKPFPVLIPRNPYDIYEAGRVMKGLIPTFPCTDRHYWTEDDFFYYWNPARPGCPLKEGRDYDRLTATLERQANTVTTYPEYDRLKDASGTIHVWLLVGMHGHEKNPDPLTSDDPNAVAFRGMREHLLGKGFVARRWSKAELRRQVHRPFRLPYIEDFTREGANGRLVVHAFSGHSSLSEDSHSFHWLLKEAMENGSVFIYAGHAGLGEFLDLSIVEDEEDFTIQPNRERYQIYFLNGCSTYSYYNTRIFARKQWAEDPTGTRNLDIVANGLATGQDFLAPSSLVLLDALTEWTVGTGRASYQDIIARMGGTNLVSINGDEDNPRE